ncbi:MAG: DUF721 domain-containing protein [Cyclobacteriaceae bacterium]
MKDKRLGNTSTLKEGIDALLKAYRLQSKFDGTKIKADWEKIVGKVIADRTKDVFIKEKKLFIKVSSSPLKRELMASKSNVLQIVRDYIGNDELVLDIVIL